MSIAEEEREGQGSNEPTWNRYVDFPSAQVGLACEPQTYFRSSLLSLQGREGGREATTVNTSAVRSLRWDKSLKI